MIGTATGTIDFKISIITLHMALVGAINNVKSLKKESKTLLQF